MTSKEPRETIQLSVLDSVLYGTARAFDYLGVRGQVMLDKIGEGILDYCLKEGYIERSNNLAETAFRIMNFFQENGYLSGFDAALEGETLTITFRGWEYLGLMKKLRNRDCYLLACPICIVGNSLFRASSTVPEPIYEDLASDGSCVRRFKLVRGSSDEAPSSLKAPKPLDQGDIKLNPTARLGLPAFQAVEYGLARSFEYLGAQAQLLLDNVGRGIIEFLREETHLSLPTDNARSLNALTEFYIPRGLSDKIDIDLSASEARLAFTNYRYAPVLKRLLEEDNHLVSCPFTLAVRTVLRNAGLAVADMQWKPAGDRNVTLITPLLGVADQEFDEDKVASMMDGSA